MSRLELAVQVADSVPSLNAATAAVKKAQQSREEEALSATEKQRRRAWKAKVGDQVRLLKAGGGTGKVTAAALLRSADHASHC